MINKNDELSMRKVYREMNIGFSAPQNGGVDGSSIMILQNGEDPEAVDAEKEGEEHVDAQTALGQIIDNLNHILRDLEQGCQGDAQIEELQKCQGTIGKVIEEIGNHASGNTNQDSAYSGLNNQDPNASDQPGGEAAAEVGMALAT